MNDTPRFQGPPIVLWDTETTGLSQSSHRIVEIALMEYPYIANLTRHLTTFVQPSLTYPSFTNSTFQKSAYSTSTTTTTSSSTPSFYNPHVLRRRMVSSSAFRAPTFATVWHMILSFVNRVSQGNPEQRPIMVAHNMPFDLRFLRAELLRIGEQLPDWDFACSLRDVAHVVWPGQPASLAALVDRFQISHTEPHRALPDVKATAEVLTHADDVLRRRERAAAKRIGITKSKKPALRPHGAYVAELLHKAALQRRERMEKEKRVESAASQASSITKAISMVSFTPNHQQKKNIARSSLLSSVTAGLSSLSSSREPRSPRRGYMSPITRKTIVEDESGKSKTASKDNNDGNSTSSSDDDESSDDEITQHRTRQTRPVDTDTVVKDDDEGSLILSDREEEVKREAKPEYVYVSPSGYLWHRNRACHKLDTAFTIHRKNKPPTGKRACLACKNQHGVCL